MSSFPFHIKEHIVPCQHIREWPRATANNQEDVLNLHVKQYTPISNPSPQPGDVTILAAHANGFPKELYEALWTDLLAQSQATGAFRIRSIWIADISNQGYSGELNEEKLGDDPCWHDHSRDLLHLTNVFRAEMPRPIVGIGHSFGANILTHLSLMHPRLLTSIIMLDPVIVAQSQTGSAPASESPGRSSTYRRDIWPGRQEAVDSFSKAPFYRAWDPRVLEAWNKHAIRDLPSALFPKSAGATLRTTKHQEVFIFYRPLYPYISSSPGPTPDSKTYTISKKGAPDFAPEVLTLPNNESPASFYRSEGMIIFRSLPAVRPSVLFILGGTSAISRPEIRAQRLSACGSGPGGSGGVVAGRVAEVVVEGRGHLFPMECPTETAGYAAQWLEKEMVRWRTEQAEYEAWTRQPLRQKSTMSPEFIEHVGPKPVKSKL